MQAVRSVRASFRWLVSRFGPTELDGRSQRFRLGDTPIDCSILEGSPSESIPTDMIRCYLSQEKLELPEDLAQLRARIEQEQERIKSADGEPCFFNGPMVALEGYSRGRTPGTEEQHLALHFIKTDYYTFLATAMSLDQPSSSELTAGTVREKYLASPDYTRPVPLLATSFGVNMTVVTSVSSFTVLFTG